MNSQVRASNSGNHEIGATQAVTFGDLRILQLVPLLCLTLVLELTLYKRIEAFSLGAMPERSFIYDVPNGGA